MLPLCVWAGRCMFIFFVIFGVVFFTPEYYAAFDIV